MTIISSGIYPIDPTVTDGTQLAGYINELVEAINSNQASSTRPPMITKGGLWTKNLTGDDIAVMVYDGSNDVEIAKMQGGNLIINNENVYTKDEVDVLLEQYVEEAPEDGKQYARKDAGWIEVEATSGGGGVEAQPPVAFSVKSTANQPIGSTTANKVSYDTVILNEGSDFDLADNSFVCSKAGIYNFQANVTFMMEGEIRFASGQIWHKPLGGSDTLVASAYGSVRETTESFKSVYISATPETTLKLEVGDKVYVNATCSDLKANILLHGSNANNGFTGHMVSSITEGEVKEKEAVVFRGNLSAEQTIPTTLWTKVNLDTIYTDDEGKKYGEDSDFVDGTFKPSVAGWYQINGSVFASGLNPVTIVNSAIGKNGKLISAGTDVTKPTPSQGISQVSDIIYLDGVNDSIELQAYMVGTTCKVNNAISNTFLSAHLITGQSTGGGTGGGETTDILPVLYSGVVNADGTVKEGTGYTPSRLGEGYYQIDFNTPLSNNKYTVNVTPSSTASNFHATFSDTSTSGFKIKVGNQNGGSSLDKDMAFGFTVTGTDTIAVGGGTGGGDYTPEKMVWEDKTADRVLGTEYTNTNDVPLYVQLYVNGDAPANYVVFFIDGQEFGSSTGLATPFYIVPAGSTYKAKEINSITTFLWKEARMPVAVGTGGGKTVAFRGELSANQTVTNNTWTKLNLDTATIDTDNALTDGKFKPSVAGYYQVNGAMNQDCTPTSSETIVSIYKNGVEISQGTYVLTSPSGSILSNTSDIVYLNGTTDYLELYGYVKSDGDCKILGRSAMTFLSAVLVSGGSASGGDSIWTEEGGVATYDGDIKVNGITVEKDSLISFYPADQSYANIKFEWDTGEAGYLNTSAFNGIKWTVNNNEAMKIDSAGHLLIGEDIWNGGASNKSGLAIQTTSSESSPFAMYITNSNNSQIFNVRCDGSTRASKLYLGDDKVDLRAELNLKDKLLEKLEARLKKIEDQLKKKKK